MSEIREHFEQSDDQHEELQAILDNLSQNERDAERLSCIKKLKENIKLLDEEDAEVLRNKKVDTRTLIRMANSIHEAY
jgi:alpha-D-ribose 1-methylphosphonate 5-triphosphate synthase subunit PhnG